MVSALTFSRQFGLASRALALRTSESVIAGAAQYPGGVRPSPQAVLHLRLADITYDNWTAVVVSEWSVSGASYSPYPFRLTYNPQQIYAGHKYGLEAALVDQNRVVARTSQPVPVVPGTGNVAVSLAPLGTTSPAIAGPPIVPWDQINQWYQTYLGRLPTSQEMASWQNHVERGQPVADIQSYLLGSSEYYGRYQNNTDYYVRGVFRTIGVEL